MGICRGLQHLHERRIFHLDLKPANVLLGPHLQPKIADFGSSRCIDNGQSKIFTSNYSGTLGYIPPEFINRQEVSFKSDIYNLGILMIRLLTGSNDNIIENVQILYQNFLLYILQQSYDLQSLTLQWHELLAVHCQQMRTCVEIAKQCIDQEPDNRPTIIEIICTLSKTETMLGKVAPLIYVEPRNDPECSIYQVCVLLCFNK
ncbi:hypothetical protein PR202_gb13331 [Eleusine coracana subsp. coracana]|uniref:Protein kinase domain-containing protein n=1 Tax=Eleusine coracana subsp. coracana TaxID=191504 RepID=A0AAV5ESL0_ELECO|nr:hypothetical protein PR202_gb13331 [Eleusine coracana subsp. coracana]